MSCIKHMIDGVCHECEIERLKYELQESKEIQARANLRYMEKCKELDLLRQSLPKIKADAVLSLLNTDHTCETPNGDDAWSSSAIEEYANKLEAGE